MTCALAASIQVGYCKTLLTLYSTMSSRAKAYEYNSQSTVHYSTAVAAAAVRCVSQSSWLAQRTCWESYRAAEDAVTSLRRNAGRWFGYVKGQGQLHVERAAS